MNPGVYINLPVADLERSRRFFEALGFSFNDAFCNDTALSMTISETCFAILLTHEKFAGFTPRAIADAGAMTEVFVCLQLDGREEVDRLCDTTRAGGTGTVRDPQDHGVMYDRAFADPDGPIWEVFWYGTAQLTGKA